MSTKPKGLLCDLDGVLYIADQPVPGAVECIEALRSAGLSIRFLTNTTTKPVAQVVQKLQNFGVPVTEADVISPLQLAKIVLKQQDQPTIFPVLREEVKPEFRQFAVDESSPDFILIGDIGDRWDYALMNKLFGMLQNGARMIALHKNRFGMKAGGVGLDIGTFVAALEYASNTESKVLGKPSADFFNNALATMELEPAEVWMVGDDLDADIGGATACGITTVLVKTGKFNQNYYERSTLRPHHLIDSIAILPNAMGIASY